MPTATQPAAPDHALITLESLSYRTPQGAPILASLSLALGPGLVGLVGENGSGKTTLLRLMAGALTPSEGRCRVEGRVQTLPQLPTAAPGERIIDMMGQGAPYDALQRILAGAGALEDYAILGDRWDLPEVAQRHLEILRLGDLPLGATGGMLSGGQATRVRLAGAVMGAPDILLLDEPTNNLDTQGRADLMTLLRGFGGLALIASHDRALLQDVGVILHLSKGQISRYGGNFSHFEAQRAAEEVGIERALADANAHLAKTRAAAQAALERQAQRAERGKILRATGSHGKMLLGIQRARHEVTTARQQSAWGQKLSDAQAARDAASQRARGTKPPNIAFPATAVPANKTVLSAQGARFRWPGARLSYALNLTIVGPERIALLGESGLGKTTLARLAVGDLTPDGGHLALGVRRVGWLDQALGQLGPEERPFDALRRLNPRLGKGEIQSLLARFQLRGELALRPGAELSGGQRTRACLACLLGAAEPPQLLVLDEPTNNLDLDTLSALEEALRAYEGCLIAISHDGAFLEAIGITREVHVGDFVLEDEPEAGGEAEGE